ncbi:inositol oxygenase [Mrakia frigida]|uniref:inositol oxygenase n=1 Tax=Mrakia frigida TaxID=29902 RepID=UPI003FCC273E
MVHAPEYLKRPDGGLFDKTSDAIDEVNVLKGKKKEAGRVKEEEDFRNYKDACDRVQNFYKEQHEKQTVEYNMKAREKFLGKVNVKMSIWEAVELLETLVDDSDPDTDVGQIEHLLQTAEAIRRDGKPEWMQLTGLIHDLGKLLYFFGAEGQWDVVGDTFVVGCAFSEHIVYPDTFASNPDSTHPVYSTPLGIYKPGCGLTNVMVSWGHDEYMYQICKKQSTLPREALAMLRYHSFYPWHREGAYSIFMDDEDHKDLEAVKQFNPYDLYSKSDDPPKVEELKPYYQGLIKKFFPDVVEW